jgi:DNA-binding GntR family transcriptional regulator
MINSPVSGSVGEVAYSQIRNDIIFGHLRPGQKLRLETLHQKYMTSVSTLREVLNRLTADGFVHSEGQKGFEVSPVSEEDLKEIADLRILLETHALERSFAFGDIDWEAQVVAAHYKLHSAEVRILEDKEKEREQWKKFDWGFHRALILACGSAALLDMHAVVFGKYLRYQVETDCFRGEVAVEEHTALLEAAKNRDVKTAKEILRKHIEKGAEHSILSQPDAVSSE